MAEQMKHQQSTVDQLLGLLEAEDAYVRQNASKDLQARRDEAVPYLGQVLNSKDATSGSRLQALAGLVEIGDPKAVPYLGRALTADPNPAVRLRCIGALERVGLIEAIPHLLRTVGDLQAEVREAAKSALNKAVQMGGQLDRYIIEGPDESIRQAAVIVLQDTDDPKSIEFLCQALDEHKHTEEALWNITSALGRIGNAAAGPVLCKTVENDGIHERVRAGAARALGLLLGFPEAIPVLCKHLIGNHSMVVREAAGEALAKLPDWQHKTDRVIGVLNESKKKHREDIDTAVIVQAIQPSEKMSVREALAQADYLVEQAVPFEHDKRMTPIMAALIVASAGNSTTLAGERINAYQKKNKLPAETLQSLRMEIGGETALEPVLEFLQKSLKDHFVDPLAKLNMETTGTWRWTVGLAQVGFVLRVIMSIAWFVLGAYLVLDSYAQVKSGNFQSGQLVGPGVSFLGGLLSMWITVSTGPLKQIRQSVNDLGIANAAFMAYIHRLLEASQTFLQVSLKEGITFDEVKKSSDLIDAAMSGTIRMLDKMEEKSVRVPSTKMDESKATQKTPPPTSASPAQ